jgi:hypothetical protein
MSGLFPVRPDDELDAAGLIAAARRLGTRDVTTAVRTIGLPTAALEPVWRYADRAVRTQVTSILARGGTLTAATGPVTLLPAGDAVVVDAEVPGLEHADAVVLPGLLVRAGALPHENVTTVGLQEIRIGVVTGRTVSAVDVLARWPTDLPTHPVEADDGPAGRGEPGPITRRVRLAAAAGGLDRALTVAVRYATERRLRGTTVAELPLPRLMMATAYADLLRADEMLTTATHTERIGPLVAGALRSLSVVLGATFYLREGPYGDFEKHLRDGIQAALNDGSDADPGPAPEPLTDEASARMWALLVQSR